MTLIEFMEAVQDEAGIFGLMTATITTTVQVPGGSNSPHKNDPKRNTTQIQIGVLFGASAVKPGEVECDFALDITKFKPDTRQSYVVIRPFVAVAERNGLL